LFLDFLDELLSSTPFIYEVNKNIVILHSIYEVTTVTDACPVLQMWIGQQEWHPACMDWVLVCWYGIGDENYSELIGASTS